MVMHARKHIRLDGYFDRNQAHPYENSGGKYSKSPFGDSCNEKSPATESGASMAAALDSPDNSRRPSPRYPNKASYTQRLKERDHHHEVKSPMSKDRSNRSREHSHHHHSSSSQHHGQSQSNSTPSTSRNKSSSSTSETSATNYTRSNHDRSHTEVKMEPEKERKGQVGDWSEHVSSSGKKYYYNCRTEVSQWEKPREWIEYEKVHGINKSSAEVPAKSKDKNSGITPNKNTERHSNSNSRASANTFSRSSQPHQHSSNHPQRESHSHTHRHERSYQSSSNRSHSGNAQRNADQASSVSSSSSNSSNSSNSSASANRASAGTARNSGRREDKTVSRGAPTEEVTEKSELRLNDHGRNQESATHSNHNTNYHSHHHNSGSSSNRRATSRKDSTQDMDISPDSSFSVDNNNFSSTGRETPRSHQYHPQHHSILPPQQQTPAGSSSTPSRVSKSSNSNFYASTPSAITTPNQSLGASSTPTNSANPQLLSPSQVTLANLPRLISQLTGTRGLPNLSEMSQQEALQTVQQALQLTKQLGGLSRSPHGTSSNLESKNALALSPALLSATAALRDGQTGNQTNFYPLGSDGARNDSNARGTAGCLSPSSDFHSHSSRQTSPASSAGSPISVNVTVNSNSNVTTSVAAAMAAAAAANSGGSLSSAVLLKPSTPSLTPSLANYYREDLVTHVTGWQADHAERQACRYSEEAHNIGSLNCTRVSAELKMARSLVRLAEIQATLQEQRTLFLRQQVKELEDRRSQNSFMMDT